MLYVPQWLRDWLNALCWFVGLPPWDISLWGYVISSRYSWLNTWFCPGPAIISGLETISNLANSMLGWLRDRVNDLGYWSNWARNVISDAWNWLNEIAWSLAQLPGRIWNDIWNWWGSRWNEITGWVWGRIADLQSTWNGLLNDVRNWVNGLVNDVRNWFNSQLAGLSSWVNGQVSNMSNWVNQRIADTTTWLQQQVAPLWTFYNAFSGLVSSFFANPFEFIVNTFLVPAATSFAAGFERGMNMPAPLPPEGGGGGPSGIIAYAMQFLGRPYVWGGNGPDVFDCSGFVKYVWQHFERTLPRTAQLQYNASYPVSTPQPGDLAFWQFEAEVDHVGMCTGAGDQMVHASSRNGYVKIDTITALGWWSFFKGYRRPM